MHYRYVFTYLFCLFMCGFLCLHVHVCMLTSFANAFFRMYAQISHHNLYAQAGGDMQAGNRTRGARAAVPRPFRKIRHATQLATC